MSVDRYVSLVYQSVILLLLGAVMGIRTADGSSLLKDKDGFTQQYENDETRTYEEDELMEEDVEPGFPDNADIEDEEIEEIVLKIKGMTCGRCEETLKTAFLACHGIKEASVSYKESEAIIKVNVFEVDYDEVVAVVNRAGFSVLEEE
ncbi:MAG: cation transporter [Candidatus Scalindua sp.]|nr:cation transporter [Candidatus Scalindua sp.]